MVSSDSETADVECFVSATDLTPIDGGFSTETYQAQYRVLEAFSLINAILILGFLLLLFILALGHHRKGYKDIWYSPVNAVDGSGQDSKKASKLPAPVTARRSHSQSRPQYTPAPKRQPQTAYIPERRAHRSRPTERYRPDYYARDASPRR
ncbi:hypothetical protein F5888DRAFT_453160 [Russula emetica]|nr:hypothetical protein F5888DRAFT_453160 [Russula emetica]